MPHPGFKGILTPMADERDLNGTVFDGRWLVMGRLGRGATAVVYRARDLQDGGEVAVKVVDPASAKMKRQRDRFHRELQALRRVDHPGIVKILSEGETSDGFLWVAMELCAGTTLTRRIAGKPRPSAEIEVVAQQLLSALGAIHRAGLIHRDIKPGNVMVHDLPDGLQVKILDFGIVRFADPDPDMSALTGINTILGTPEFMAPEMIRTGTSDHRADLYALGITLYQMATGKLPFTNKLAGPVLQAQVHQTPEPVAVSRGEPLPPRLERLLQRLLAKEPRDRPATAEDGLRILAGGTPTRRRGFAWLVAAVVGSVIVGIGTGLLVLAWVFARYLNAAP
jgi:serine/threonine-protein kinase